jgi:5,10-methylene-tetrahydrofolate dehydrogenase/methenyl tetrahydrofolate cyclohydrolase
LDFHVACTPQGCIELLDRYNIPIEGKEAVVVGRSNIVGIPVSMLLLQRNATLTIAHSRTRNLEEVVRRADIVVAAVGRAEMVKGAWIKPGAAVIDVGINSVDDPSAKRGYRLVGDVEFDVAKEVAGAITPVSANCESIFEFFRVASSIHCGMCVFWSGLHAVAHICDV